MAAIKQLAAVTRSGTGKGAARSVRREGRVPGVIYGGGEKAEPISVDFKELNKLIYAGHFLTTIFELDVEGRKERVLPRDYQLDVVTDKPLHVDFLRLRAGSRVRIARAGPRRQSRRFARASRRAARSIWCCTRSSSRRPPTPSPRRSPSISTGLDFHDSVHVSALKLPEGCRPADTKADFTVVTIVPPTVYPGRGAGRGRRDFGARPPPAAAAAAARRRRRRRPRAPPPRRPKAPPPRRPSPPPRSNAPAAAAYSSARPPARRAGFFRRGRHAPDRRPRQSRRAPRQEPPQHRLHGGRGDRREHRIGPFRARFQGPSPTGRSATRARRC